VNFDHFYNSTQNILFDTQLIPAKPTSDFRLRKESDYQEWLQSNTRYGDAAISYTTINARIR